MSLVAKKMMLAAAGAKKPTEFLRSTTKSGSGSYTATHTFGSDCDFCVIVSCFYDSVAGSAPNPLAVSVDGTSATQQAIGAYNVNTFTEAAYIHTLENPTTGSSITISSSNEDTSQTWAIYIYEFSGVLDVGAVTSDTSYVGTTRPGAGVTTLTTPAISVNAESIVVYGVVAGIQDNDYITAFTGYEFSNVPTSASSVFYASASAPAYYATAGSKTEGWTISLTPTDNNPYFFPVAIELKNISEPDSLFYSFNTEGTDGGLAVASVTNSDFGTGDFTYEAWVYPTSLANNFNAVVGHKWASGGGILYVRSDGSINFYEGSSIIDAGDGVISTDQWHHVAAVRSSGTLTLYIDGTSVGSTSYTNSITDTNLYVGQNHFDNEEFQGYIYRPHVVDSAKYTGNFTPSIDYSTEANSLILLVTGGSTVTDLEGNSVTNNGATFVAQSP